METAKSVTPLPEYITLKLLDPETETASGIILPETSQEKPQIGKVLAIGILYKEDMVKANVDNSLEAIKILEFQRNVKVGDTVVFKKYTGNPVKIQDEEVQLVEFKDCLGIIDYGS